jgi:hypothetical protein
MGIDQYGQIYHNLGQHPRKALMEKLGYKSADKMYVDKKDSSIAHVGYIVGGYWINLFKVEPFEKIQ